MLLLEGSHAFFMQILHDLDHRLILFRTRSWFRNSAWLFLLNCECTWSILKECTLRMHLFWYLQRSWTVDHWLLCNLRVCVCVLIIFNLIWNSFGIAAFPCWGDLQPAGQLLLVQGAPPLPQAHRTGSVAVTRLFQNAVTMPLGWRMKTTLTTSCQFLTEGPHATRAYEANHIEDWKINLHITCPFSRLRSAPTGSRQFPNCAKAFEFQVQEVQCQSFLEGYSRQAFSMRGIWDDVGSVLILQSHGHPSPIWDGGIHLAPQQIAVDFASLSHTTRLKENLQKDGYHIEFTVYTNETQTKH